MYKYLVILLLAVAACNNPIASGVVVTYNSGTTDTIHTGPIAGAWLDAGDLRVQAPRFSGNPYTAACFVRRIDGYVPMPGK